MYYNSPFFVLESPYIVKQLAPSSERILRLLYQVIRIFPETLVEPLGAAELVSQSILLFAQSLTKTR